MWIAKNKPEDWILVSVPWVTGRHTITIHHEHYALYRENPIAAACKYLNVTESEYLDWLACGGRIRCMALTVHGKRCRFTVGPAITYPNIWVSRAHAGAYCGVHGSWGRR